MKPPYLKQKPWVRMSLLAIIVGLAFVGCVYIGHTERMGRPIDQDAISRIVIGMTTRSEVIKLLGLPEGQFAGQVSFTDSNYMSLGSGKFYRHVANRYLDSLDDKHYAMLYRVNRSSGQSWEFGEPFGRPTKRPSTMITISHADSRFMTDELLLLVTKDTDIVEDFAYRKEPAQN